MATLSAALPEIPQGQAVRILIDGVGILLCRSVAGIHAAKDACPHRSLSMHGALVRGSSVICPHHGARFSLEDGRSLSPLTQSSLHILRCRIGAGEIEIDL